MAKSQEFGTLPVSKLILQQAVPASIGFLVMSVYMIVDTVFVGHFVGALAISAITVVMPISFFISSIGMAIGVGGASVISRALGAEDGEYAKKAFGNMFMLTGTISLVFVVVGLSFNDELLLAFGGKGEILPYARKYFNILCLGAPFLAYAMMCNQIIRTIGFPKIAMYVMLIPALVNVVLDPILIIALDMGIEGAAWATTASYFGCGIYALWFILARGKELQLEKRHLKLHVKAIAEVSKLGGVTLARQGTISLLSLVLNNGLYAYGGEMYIAAYGIVNRLMMFSFFPVLGITQGFLPITGFNYGAKKYARVKEIILKSILYGTLVNIVIYVFILAFDTSLVKLFTDEALLLEIAPPALVTIFLATPFVLVQLIGSAYFQAIGKAVPALLLTLSKQGFFLIPLVFFLPMYYGVEGIWYAFPIADISSTILTFFFLKSAWAKLR